MPQLLCFNLNSYTGVTLLYTGMMYHEEKKVNEWMTTFSVVRDLEVLQQVCNVIYRKNVILL